MPSIITYTTVVNVKRVLRSNVQKRINFSGHYRNLGGGTDNTSTIALSAVSFYDNYEKQASVILEFQTDTTDYKITSVDESTGARGEINLGTYDFETDVTTSDGMIILAANFSGAPTVAGDRVTFETEVHMSIDDLYEYIRDTEIFVDGILKENVYQDTTIALNTILFADTASTPNEVAFATTRMAAFFIFNDVYVQNIEGLQTMEPKGLILHPVINWYNQGMRMLNRYMDSFISQDTPSAPRWLSWRRFFASRGVTDVGTGIGVPRLDDTPTTLFNSDYDDLLELDVITTSNDEITSG